MTIRIRLTGRNRRPSIRLTPTFGSNNNGAYLGIELSHPSTVREGVSRSQLSPGDHVTTSRPLYQHHGIYAGRGRVIHYYKRNTGEASVAETSLEAFSRGGLLGIKRRPGSAAASAAILAAARGRIGEARYSVLLNNCENLVDDAYAQGLGSR